MVGDEAVDNGDDKETCEDMRFVRERFTISARRASSFTGFGMKANAIPENKMLVREFSV